MIFLILLSDFNNQLSILTRSVLFWHVSSFWGSMCMEEPRCRSLPSTSSWGSAPCCELLMNPSRASKWLLLYLQSFPDEALSRASKWFPPPQFYGWSSLKSLKMNSASNFTATTPNELEVHILSVGPQICKISSSWLLGRKTTVLPRLWEVAQGSHITFERTTARQTFRFRPFKYRWSGRVCSCWIQAHAD